MPLGIIAAIYSSIAMALSQASLKKSYRNFVPSVAFFFEMVFGLVLWIPVALYFGVSFINFPIVIIYAIISAILCEVLWFYVLSKGELGLTAILVSSYPIYTIFFSHFINHETLSHQQAIFIAITILGTLICYLPGKIHPHELRKTSDLAWPLLAAVGIGLSDALSKKIINQTGDFTFLFALALVQIPVSLIYLKIEKQQVLVHIKAMSQELYAYKNVLAGTIFGVIATCLLWISFTKTLASIASPITATCGAIVVIFSLIFLDERIKPRQLLGVLLVIVGIVGISMRI